MHPFKWVKLLQPSVSATVAAGFLIHCSLLGLIPKVARSEVIQRCIINKRHNHFSIDNMDVCLDNQTFLIICNSYIDFREAFYAVPHFITLHNS